MRTVGRAVCRTLGLLPALALASCTGSIANNGNADGAGSGSADGAHEGDAGSTADGGGVVDAGGNPDGNVVVTGIIPEDRRVDWRPGIPGGIPAITTVCANVRNAPYNAQGDGVADDSPAIQAAIDACPPGQAVLVPAGTYRLATGLSFVKGIVLRGEGPGQTKLEGDGITQKAIVQIGTWDETVPEIAVNSGFTKGSTRLVVADASVFAAGDFVIVDQENDGDLVWVTGSESACVWGSRDNGTRLLGQIVQVKSVDSGTRTLVIDPPLAFGLTAGLHPEVTKVRKNMPQRAGIENLTVSDRSFRGDNNANIRFWGAAYSWVKNVESAYVSGRHIQVTKCFRCEVRDSWVHHAWVYDPGANAYGISVENQTSETLVENNVVYSLNVGIVGASHGPGNVIAYNYMDRMYERRYPQAPWLMADLSGNHCAHPYMALWEGNMVSQISLDDIHGSSSHNTFFRNYVDRQHEGLVHTGNLTDVVVAARNRYVNLIGNVLGRPGDKSISGAVYEQASGNCLGTVAVYKFGYPSDCGVSTITDPQVRSTLLRTGNYDYVTESTKWEGAPVTLPASLYLSGRPAFWSSAPWPPIGPDVTPLVSDIPAKTRFDGLPH